MPIEGDALLQTCRELARRAGVRYVDARFTAITDDAARVRNDSVEMLSSDAREAVGVRVLWNDGWGFCGSTDASDDALALCARRALESAHAAHLAMNERVRFDPRDAVRGTWESPCEIDPAMISVGARLDLLRDANERARVDPRIRGTASTVRSRHHTRTFASSEESLTTQTWRECGGGIEVTAESGGEIQKRSYPDSSDGDSRAAGWEFIREMNLPNEAPRVGREAVELLDAPRVGAGVTDLVILSSQMALQIHESIGHPVELDRILGWEIPLAGGSFLTLRDVGSLEYASRLVNVTADATLPGALGSFGWDDEGTPAQRVPIIVEGRLTDLLSSRETAPRIGRSSNGTVRGEAADHLPLIRMTNISLEPGTSSLEELIGGVENGWLIDTNTSWSIDDVRLAFQFSCEIAWKIENGRVGRMHRNPVYSGRTPQFWRSCDGVGDRSTWRLWGLANCGKGDPMQTMRVGHGAPAARFRGVQVG